MVALCALVHAAGLAGISRLFHLEDAELKARKTAATLGLIVVIALVLFVLHLAEIALFAALYAGVGAAPDFADALYYSASAYTTAGNGIEDLGKGWRLLGATEALAGFLLIGWSVAYLVARLRRLREQPSGRLLALLAAGLGDLPQDHLALEAGEMVDEQYALEMVHLVLEADREQTLDLLFMGGALLVEPAGADPVGPVDLAILVGHRKAALGIGHLPVRMGDDLGIDED